MGVACCKKKKKYTGQDHLKEGLPNQPLPVLAQPIKSLSEKNSNQSEKQPIEPIVISEELSHRLSMQEKPGQGKKEVSISGIPSESKEKEKSNRDKSKSKSLFNITAIEESSKSSLGWSFNFLANKKSILKYYDASPSSDHNSLMKLAKELSLNSNKKKGIHQPQITPNFNFINKNVVPTFLEPEERGVHSKEGLWSFEGVRNCKKEKHQRSIDQLFKDRGSLTAVPKESSFDIFYSGGGAYFSRRQKLNKSTGMKANNLEKTDHKIISVISLDESLQVTNTLSKNNSGKGEKSREPGGKVKIKNNSFGNNHPRRKIGDIENRESEFPEKASFGYFRNFNNKNLSHILDFSLINESFTRKKVITFLSHREYINNHQFPVWNPEIHEKLSHYQEEKPFQDINFNRDFNLDFFNKQKFDWTRISQLPDIKVVTDNDFNPINVIQGRANTCSIIVAMINISNYYKMFKINLLRDIIHPQINNCAIINPCGKYAVKLTVNGGKRYVEIDDYLLANSGEGGFKRGKKNLSALESNPTGSLTFYGASSNGSNEIWMTLIEKAIVKLYGDNYESIDSNPCFEVYHLCGWIPECVRFYDIPNKDSLWSRLFQNFQESNIVISLGTEDRSILEDSNLIEGHAYSLLEMREMKKQRLLRCKNPWGKSSPKISLRSLNSDENEGDSEAIMTDIKKGIFWITWESVLKFFSCIYLSWNPAIYPHRKIFNSKYVKGPRDCKMWNEKYSLEYNPQYMIKIPPHEEDFEVRVFLDRHITETLNKKFKNNSGFKLFSYEGERVVFPNDAIRTYPYSSRELLSDVFIFEASNHVEHYVLVILKSNIDGDENINAEEETFFTLHVLSFLEIEIIEMPFRVIFQEQSENLLIEQQHIGGAISSPEFYMNPQYLLSLPHEVDVQIKIQGPTWADLMIVLIKAEKEGDYDIKKIPYNLVFNNVSPGFYFQGFSFLETTLSAGNYIMLLSIQAPEGFQASASPSANTLNIIVKALEDELTEKIDFIKEYHPGIEEYYFKLLPIRPEAKKYQKQFIGEWNSANSRGTYRISTDLYQAFYKNPGYLLKFDHEIEFFAHLRSLDYQAAFNHARASSDESFELEPPSICIGLYKILDDFRFEVVLEDDQYAPVAWGYQTPQISLKSNSKGYLLLALNYEKGFRGKFELTLSSDKGIPDVQESFSLFQRKYNNTFKGEWTNANSGGCCSELEFFKNPQYLIRSEVNTTAFIELVNPDSFPVGLYLVESEGLAISEFPTSILESAQTNPAFLIELNLLIVELTAKTSYNLIPCTYKSGQKGEYQISISSDQPVGLKEINSMNYNWKVKLRGYWVRLSPDGYQGMENDDQSELSHSFYTSNEITFLAKNITRVNIHLIVPAEDEEVPISIHLFELNMDGTRKHVNDSGTHVAFKMGCFLSTNVQPNANGYQIVFSSLTRTTTNTYSYEIACSEPDDIVVVDTLEQEAFNTSNMFS